MAGYGHRLAPHPFLAMFADSPFQATAEQLIVCASGIESTGSTAEQPSAALQYGLAVVAATKERLAEKGNDGIEPLFGWYDINFQLTHNLGSLGLAETVTAV